MTWAYPVPAARERELVNSYMHPGPPGGGTYQRGAHYGIDIPWPGNPHVFCIGNGKVISTGDVWGPSYGNQVLVRHLTTTGYRWSFYAHLDSIWAKAGASIRRGDPIGILGATGNVSGPHVHFEYHSSSQWTKGMINPYNALEAARRAIS